ncbi:MAG: YceI family protein [Balneolaceae bacterium]|nr:MAG: YceI family protein [Balneolaceae bacterium]
MKYFSRSAFFLFILMILTVCPGESISAQYITYIPEEVSKLWIEGRSNINEFECQANQYFGEATLFDNPGPVEFSQSMQERVFLQVEIRVDGFECGRSRMNRDLQQALKSNDFPEITFLFDSANMIEFPESNNGAFKILVKGTLTVAGNTRDIQFVTNAYYLEPTRVRAIGKTTIRMTDFDVEPPTALMGLVKADDELTVSFDLVAKETDQLCQLCPAARN